MLSLSPVKLMVVLVVAMILLGPDKMPQLARQMGAAWKTFRTFHQRVEEEVRGTIPDLPSTQELARLARSPVQFLNQLADLSPTDLEAPVPDPGDQATPPVSDSSWPSDPSDPGPGAPDAGPPPTRVVADGAPVGPGPAVVEDRGAGDVTATPAAPAAEPPAPAAEPPAPDVAAGSPVPGGTPSMPDDPSMN